MEVYHGNNIWGKGKPENKLTAIPVNRSFLWDKQEILIPAVYVGKAGAALDVCAKIPTGDMAAFLKKWDYEKRMSLKTPEEFEQLDTDNPASREFAVEICLDDTPLLRSMSSSMRWYPENIIQMEFANPDGEDRFENNKSAEEWMNAYDCDRECCWYFERLCYNWDKEPILSPRKISLAFQANLISITVGHFFTDIACEGETIKIFHPVTGQEYILTLHGCEQFRHSFTEIEAEGMVYPEYCQVLSYSITPEIDRSLFAILDCTKSDKPRMVDTQALMDIANGPTAIFMTRTSADSKKLTAVSSMHFEPVPKVQWRVVFQIKPKSDAETDFTIEA